MKKAYLTANKIRCPLCGLPARVYVADAEHAYLKCDWKSCPNDAHPSSEKFAELIKNDLARDGIELVTEEEFFIHSDSEAEQLTAKGKDHENT